MDQLENKYSKLKKEKVGEVKAKEKTL